jgi:23S rRNA pseudouridine955/2504/2580 synthase
MKNRSVHRSRRPRPVTLPPALDPAAVAVLRARLIHEDAALLAFDKPAGLSTQGGSGVRVDLDTLLWAFARSGGRKPRLVHRLDRDTSGVLVVARTKPAAAHLSEQFAGRTARKTYLALVAAHPEAEAGTIDAALAPISSGGIALVRVVPGDAPGALSAITDWRVVARGAGASLIEANPRTGRMHQIRAHLAHLGHPILGDSKYGGPLLAAGLAVPRLMLHAAQLDLVHPGDQRALTLTAPLPDDMATLCDGLTISASPP